MRFYYPQKPTRITLSSQLIEECERDNNYIAQKKKDGWRVQIHKDKDSLHLLTRHNKPLKPYVTDVDWDHTEQFLLEHLECDSCVLDGEFIHKRTALHKNIFYLWDIFELNGERLNLPYKDRKYLLDSITRQVDGLFIAKNYTTNFLDLWEELDRSIDEGIIIKDLEEPLHVSFSKTVKSPRQFKVLLDDKRNYNIQ